MHAGHDDAGDQTFCKACRNGAGAVLRSHPKRSYSNVVSGSSSGGSQADAASQGVPQLVFVEAL